MTNLSLQFLNPLAPMRDLISGSKISIQSLFVARTLCHECTSSMLVGREFAFFFFYPAYRHQHSQANSYIPKIPVMVFFIP